MTYKSFVSGGNQLNFRKQIVACLQATLLVFVVLIFMSSEKLNAAEEPPMLGFWSTYRGSNEQPSTWSQTWQIEPLSFGDTLEFRYWFYGDVEILSEVSCTDTPIIPTSPSKIEVTIFNDSGQILLDRREITGAIQNFKAGTLTNCEALLPSETSNTKAVSRFQFTDHQFSITDSGISSSIFNNQTHLRLEVVPSMSSINLVYGLGCVTVPAALDPTNGSLATTGRLPDQPSQCEEPQHTLTAINETANPPTEDNDESSQITATEMLASKQDTETQTLEAMLMMIAVTSATVLAAGFSSRTKSSRDETKRNHDSATSDVDQSNGLQDPYKTPSRPKSDSGHQVFTIDDEVGWSFRVIVTFAHQLSRIRLFRTGLRRWVELGIQYPVGTLCLPVMQFLLSAILAVLISSGTVSTAFTVTILVILAVPVPSMTFVVAAGWFVGRAIDDISNMGPAVVEIFLLLPGAFFLPAMIRAIVGPPRKSTTLEKTFLFIAVPPLLVVVLSNWLMGLAPATNAAIRFITSTLNIEWPVSTFDLIPQVRSVVAGLIIMLFLYAIAFLRAFHTNEDGEAKPLVFLPRRSNTSSQLIREPYCETFLREVGEPNLMNHLIRYVLAFGLMWFALAEFVGGIAFLFSGFFLLGVFIIRLRDIRIGSGQIHPGYKVFGVGLTGILISLIAVPRDASVLAIGLIALIGLISETITTRQLWETNY